MPKIKKIKKKSIKKLILSLVILFFITCFLFFLILSGRHAIIYTDNNFSPSQIYIDPGDTVTFKNNSSRDMWPASNTHPDHTIYPDFDPKKAIAPGDSWSFRFTKDGKWRFHDHLNANVGGVIIVGENRDSPAGLYTMQKCLNEEQALKPQCYEELIYQALEEEGIQSAFDIVEEIQNTTPQDMGDCHGITHEIGKKAFHLFSEDKSLALSTKSSYCGYGFYHGFMEELLITTGDIQEARNFCKYAGDALRESTTDAEGACYHGIGHGLVEDVPPQELWGDAQGIIDRGNRQCELVSDNTDKLFRCTSGVYNAYEIIASAKKYNLSLPANPLSICDVQKEEYKNACYTQLVVPIIGSTYDEHEATAQIIEKIPTDLYARDTLISTMVEWAHQGKNDVSMLVEFCNRRQPRLRNSCITGFAEGFMKYGPPQNEYVKTFQICQSPEFDNSEKRLCFERILPLLRIWYAQEKAISVCRSVPREFQVNNCQY